MDLKIGLNDIGRKGERSYPRRWGGSNICTNTHKLTQTQKKADIFRSTMCIESTFDILSFLGFGKKVFGKLDWGLDVEIFLLAKLAYRYPLRVSS